MALVKARKSRCCGRCGEPIPRGEVHHGPGKFDPETPAVCLSCVIEHSGDGAATTIKAENALGRAESVVREMLADAGFNGVLRRDIIPRLSKAGIQDASKAATRNLGRLHRAGEIKKRRAGRAMKYWQTSTSPSDAKSR